MDRLAVGRNQEVRALQTGSKGAGQELEVQKAGPASQIEMRFCGRQMPPAVLRTSPSYQNHWRLPTLRKCQNYHWPWGVGSRRMTRDSGRGRKKPRDTQHPYDSTPPLSGPWAGIQWSRMGPGLPTFPSPPQGWLLTPCL